MNLRDFFCGTPEESAAWKEAKRLRAIPNPHARDRRRLDAARILTRRHALRVLGSAFALGAAGFGAITFFSPKETAKREASNEFLDTADVRTLYDEGFSLLMQNVPSEPHPEYDMDTNVLVTLKDFQSRVLWATLQGDRYIAAESGQSFGAWLAVIPKDNPLAREQRHMAVMESMLDGQHFVKIRPAPMTRVWAGLLAVHEISHLMDRAYEIESTSPSQEEFLLGEVRAYGIELLAADRFSQGRFRQSMQTLFQQFGWNTIDDVRSLTPEETAMAREKLNSALTLESPKSLDEMALRDGFFQIILPLELIVKSPLSPEEKLNRQTQIIGFIHHETGTFLP